MQKNNGHYDLSDTIERQPSILSIKLPAGNTLLVDKDANELKLLGKDQVLQLTIKIKEEGLVVNVNASQLNITGTDELNLSSKKINIEASEQINIKSNGNLVQQIGKDCLTETGGTNKNIARIQKLTASLGNVEIKANDDVKLDGESVKLNSDE
jgi:hypothetical protein